MFGHISPMMSKTSTMEITNKQKDHTDNHTIVSQPIQYKETRMAT